MGLQFKWPWLLLLIPVLVAYVVFTIQRSARLRGWRKVIAVCLRSLLVIVLLIALSGVESYVVQDRKSIVFVVDGSDSMSKQQSIIDWIIAAANDKREEDRIGIATFGAQAQLERHPSNQPLSAWSFNSRINPAFTHIASGLQLAGTLDTADAGMRVVLVSDGQENVGDMHKQALLLQNKRIPVDVLITDPISINDMAIERLDIPEELYQGEKYSLNVTIQSTYATEAVMRIYEDDVEISQQNVYIERGENRFVMQGVAVHAGLHRYRAEIYAADDQQLVNNVHYAFSQVIGPPKVLVVEGQPGESQNLLNILEGSFIPYDVIVPEFLSAHHENYVGYESIIFANVPAERVPEYKMEMIEQAVRDYGVGFVMIGGDNSFGIGGYLDTPIERALPVYMDLRGKREIPSLGLVLVIDKSGSMAGDRIALAREAAARTVELMRDKDTVGVLAFDSSPWWVARPQPLAARDEVLEAISSIQADGGTEIYTAVKEGLEALRGIDAQRKHMILLTDGMSATMQNYATITADLADENITISTVGIGDGADQQLLQHIAQLGNGRYYFTDDQSTVPEIFSREAVLISRTYIVDDPFLPVIENAGEWQHLFREGVPMIHAYIASTLKETAEATLISPEPDPLLARWQYGAGRTVAWTSDLSGQWSGDWIRWESLPQVFADIIKWTFPQFKMTPFQLHTRLEENRVIIDVKSHLADFQGELRAIISDGDGEEHIINLVPTMPGEYAAEFEIEEMGAYLTRIDVYDRVDSGVGENTIPDEVQADREGAADVQGEGRVDDADVQLVGHVTTGFVIPYSPEYKVSTYEPHKLERLAELTGGRVLSLENPEEVFQGEVEAKRMVHDLVPYLLIVALMLWLVDIANRRLTIPWRRLLGRRRSSQAGTDFDGQAKDSHATGKGHSLSGLMTSMKQGKHALRKEAQPHGMSGQSSRHDHQFNNHSGEFQGNQAQTYKQSGENQSSRRFSEVHSYKDQSYKQSGEVQGDKDQYDKKSDEQLLNSVDRAKDSTTPPSSLSRLGSRLEEIRSKSNSSNAKTDIKPHSKENSDHRVKDKRTGDTIGSDRIAIDRQKDDKDRKNVNRVSNMKDSGSRDVNAKEAQSNEVKETSGDDRLARLLEARKRGRR